MYGFDNSISTSQKIKYLRTQSNMTQREFAQYLGISLRALQGWEQENRKPAQGVADLIQRVLIAENIIPCPGPLEKYPIAK